MMQRIFLAASVLFGTVLLFFLTTPTFFRSDDVGKIAKDLESLLVAPHRAATVVHQGADDRGSPGRDIVVDPRSSSETKPIEELKSKPMLSAFPPAGKVSTPGALLVAPTARSGFATGTAPEGESSSGVAIVGAKGMLGQNAIIALTNLERNRAGLPSLSVNKRLSAMAEAKAVDMISRQYFAHVAPDGTDITMLADKYGYQFLNVGENLALGDFPGSADVVLAWMNSPGHRKNILNPQYTEIGVGALRGVHGGREVWYAVQEFGRPFPDCARPEPLLKEKIAIYQNELTALESTLSNLGADIDASPGDPSAIARKVGDYNAIVQLHNDLVASTTAAVDRYNKEAHDWNVCAGLE